MIITLALIVWAGVGLFGWFQAIHLMRSRWNKSGLPRPTTVADFMMIPIAMFLGPLMLCINELENK